MRHAALPQAAPEPKAEPSLHLPFINRQACSHMRTSAAAAIAPHPDAIVVIVVALANPVPPTTGIYQLGLAGQFPRNLAGPFLHLTPARRDEPLLCPRTADLLRLGAE